MTSTSLTEALRETLALFDASGAPRTTTEAAERLDLGRRSTYERLERLVEGGHLETKKVGANGRVWWRPPSAPTDGRPAGAPNRPAIAESLVDDVLDGAEVGVFVLDEAFEVAWINEATERYFGLAREHVVGRDKRTLVEERIAPSVENSTEFAETVRSTYDDNTCAERFECRVTPGEGREARWLEHRSKPIESGTYAGGRIELYYDVTARRESEHALHKSERRFRSLVQTVEEYAIFMLDPEGYVRTWNEGAARIKGHEPGGIVGEHFSTFYTPEDCEAGVPERNLERAAAEGVVTDEGWRLRADGSRFWAHVTITAIRDDDGALEGFAKVTRDQTDRREREQQLRRERETVERVLETVPVGIGVVSAEGEFVRTNERATELLGIAGDARTYELDDYELYDADGSPFSREERPINRVVETGEAVREQRCRIDHPDGGRRWLSVSAAPLEDEGGEVERVVVAGEDVTQLEEQARRLERQRDDLESELEDVFERVDDGFFAVDRDLRFTHANERAVDLLDCSPGELLGRHIRDAFEPGQRAEAAFEEALETGESATFEEYYERLDTWFENRVYPSETGLSVYFRDITERKERERSLERYVRIIDAVNEPVYELDAEGRITFVNDAFVEYSGYEERELLGSHVSIGMDDEAIARGEAKIGELLANDSTDRVTLEYEVVPKDGDRIPVENRISLLFDDDGGIRGSAGVLWDITERKEHERELERYGTILSSIDDGVYVVDDDGRFTTVNEAYTELIGYSREELIGAHVSKVADEATQERARAIERELATGGCDTTRLEAEIETATGERVPVEATFALITDDGGGGYERVGVVRDITERKERERALEESRRRRRTVVDNFPNGAVAMFDEDLRYLIVGGRAYAGLDVSARDMEGSLISEHVPDELLEAIEPRYRAVFEGEASEFEAEYEGEIRRFQTLPVHDESGSVFAGIAMSQDVTERVERERELERQRERLAAINDLNGVVRDITEAVIEQSTREEVEEIVCERLADAESYEFAWIGEVDPRTGSIVRREEAGVEGYLGEVSLSTDAEDPAGRGPAGRAVRTREIRVTQDALTDPEFEPWREYAEEYGYRSTAAIPIVHGDTLYGVLGVYASRPRAFEGEERDVIAQVGEVVGHAIAAIERKRALMSDEVTEIEFAAPDVLASLGVDADVEGTVTFDRVVPTGKGEFLQYGTADEGAIDALEALVEGYPHVETSKVFGRTDDSTRFEFRLSEPPVVSAVASHGGYVPEARIEGGDLHMSLHLPSTVGVRRVIDAVQDAYPTAHFLSRRQIRREEPSARIQRAVTEDLTDRQRATLEAAVYLGFFEWPRENSGEEVATSLDIAPSTFHQHLRKAQRKVFESVFPTPG